MVTKGGSETNSNSRRNYGKEPQRRDRVNEALENEQKAAVKEEKKNAGTRNLRQPNGVIPSSMVTNKPDPKYGGNVPSKKPQLDETLAGQGSREEWKPRDEAGHNSGKKASSDGSPKDLEDLKSAYKEKYNEKPNKKDLEYFESRSRKKGQGLLEYLGEKAEELGFDSGKGMDDLAAVLKVEELYHTLKKSTDRKSIAQSMRIEQENDGAKKSTWQDLPEELRDHLKTLGVTKEDVKKSGLDAFEYKDTLSKEILGIASKHYNLNEDQFDNLTDEDQRIIATQAKGSIQTSIDMQGNLYGIRSNVTAKNAAVIPKNQARRNSLSSIGSTEAVVTGTILQAGHTEDEQSNGPPKDPLTGTLDGAGTSLENHDARLPGVGRTQMPGSEVIGSHGSISEDLREEAKNLGDVAKGMRGNIATHPAVYKPRNDKNVDLNNITEGSEHSGGTGGRSGGNGR